MAGTPTHAVPSTPPLATAETGSPSPGRLVIDTALLAILPADAGGIPIVASPETAAEMVADPSLQRSASAVAVGAAIDPATGDLAIASVVQLRPGTYSAGFFEDWRADYDEAACEPAGGVSRPRAAGSSAPTPSYVTACGRGLAPITSTWRATSSSRSPAAGERGLGDLVMAGLRE